jgi:hypothetical protein
MKKSLFTVLLVIGISANANTCMCTVEINNIFEQIANHVIDVNVNPTSNNIENILIPQIVENRETIDSENDQLERMLRAEKQKSLEANRLVFLLNKTLQINNLE